MRSEEEESSDQTQETNLASKSSKQNENESNLLNYDYYLPFVTRDIATEILKELQENGSFIIRKKFDKPSQPYSMSIFLNNQIFNLEIRRLDHDKWALGKPRNQESFFDSVPAIVDYYSHHYLGIPPKGATKLKIHPKLVEYKNKWQ